MINTTFTHLKAIRLAQLLFFVNAAIWLGIGVVSLFRIPSGPSGYATTAWVFAILMFGNAGAMLIAGMGLGWRQRLFCYFGMVVLVVNIILSVTDEFGVIDLVTLMLDIILLGLLIGTRLK